jgi:hypothetical protein
VITHTTTAFDIKWKKPFASNESQKAQPIQQSTFGRTYMPGSENAGEDLTVWFRNNNATINLYPGGYAPILRRRDGSDPMTPGDQNPDHRI